MKLVEIKKAEKVIFVGDTHGDLEASQKVIKDYLKPGNKIVFLGDYVDRGSYSKENLEFLLQTKTKNPDQIYLLQGNHEGHHILKFSPAEFWKSLSKEEYQKYSSIVEKFPLVVSVRLKSDPTLIPIVALHGALPDVENLEEINKIKLGDENWFRICWGDFSEEPGEYLGIDPFSGRPKFGRDYFFKLMEKFKKKILIRSHDSEAPLFMFNDRCLTIFTSSAYKKERLIAIANLSKEIENAKNLEIKKI